MSFYQDIRSALVSQLLDSPAGQFPVLHDNAELGEQSGTWLQAIFSPLTKEIFTCGTAGQDEAAGLFRVLVNSPQGAGSSDGLEVIDSIQTFFEAGSTLRYANVTVTILSVSLAESTFTEDGNTYITPITVEWECLRVRGATSNPPSPSCPVIPPDSREWQRPEQWINYLDFENDTEAIWALIQVIEEEENRRTSFKIRGAYQIDWGDGIVDQTNSAQWTHHSYDYDTLNAPEVSAGIKQIWAKITPQLGQQLVRYEGDATYFDEYGHAKKETNILELVLKVPNMTQFYSAGSSNSPKASNLQHVKFLNSDSLQNVRNGFKLYDLRQVEFVNGTPNLTDVYSWMNNIRNDVTIKGMTIKTLYGLGRRASIYFDLSTCTVDLPSNPDISRFSDGGGISNITELWELITIDRPIAIDLMWSSTYHSPAVMPPMDMVDFTHPAGFVQAFSNSNFEIIKPITNSGHITNWQSAFTNCLRLREIQGVDMSGATNVTNTFINSNNLYRCAITGINVSFSLANTLMDVVGMEELANGLPTVSGGQEININNTPFASNATTADLQRFTDKGWTLTF
jgi:hypothetical protein